MKSTAMMMIAVVMACSGMARAQTQQQTSEGIVQEDWSNLTKELRAGQSIRVAIYRDGIVDGKFAGVSSEGIFVKVGGKKNQQIKVPRVKVYKVTSRKSKRLMNALKGLGMGTVMGGLMVEEINSSEAGAAAAVVLIASPVIGVIAGALDSDSSEEIMLYRNPNRQNVISEVTSETPKSIEPLQPQIQVKTQADQTADKVAVWLSKQQPKMSAATRNYPF